jgi:fibronectin-binding autotransporter adhesin
MKHAIIEPLESRIAPASIIVNTLSDQIDSPGSHTISLRDAIAAANASTHPTTILFKSGLTGTISLSPGASYGEFLIAHPVTIIGPGPGKLIISASGSSSRIFDVEASASISGMSLIDGNGAGADDNGSGGAIYSNHSLSLSNVVISGNTNSSAEVGGGVYVLGTSPGVSVTVKNCVISGNQSDVGAGGIEILATKSVQILNTLISGNTGASTSNYGGGLFVQVTSSSSGISLSGDTIVNNKAGSSSLGGGAYLEGNGAPISLVNSTISGNTSATAAGGLFLYQPVGKGTVSVTNTLVSNNSGTTGGGIDAVGGKKMTFSGVTVDGNHASQQGGGLYVNGNTSAVVISVTGSHIVDNIASSNGGGIFAHNNASLALVGSTVGDNRAGGGGGGVYITGNGNLTITGGAVSGNFTSGVGGGIYAPSGGNVTITGTTLSHNICNASDGGGAILTNTSETVKLTGITVTGNDSIGNDGGGVFIDASASTSRFLITGGNFSGNFAGDDGGGIELLGIGSGKISGAHITGNIAADSAGGLFDNLTTPADLTITGTTVANNIALFDPNALGI